MLEIELFGACFGILFLSIGISKIIKSKTGKNTHIEIEPTTQEIYSVIDEAKEKMTSSIKLREIDAFESLKKDLIDLRSRLEKHENIWQKEGTLFLKEITELADGYILGNIETKNYLRNPLKGYRNMEKCESNIIALLGKVRNKRAMTISGTENIITLSDKFTQLIKQINLDVERGILAGKDDISTDVLLLRGVKFDYLPQTLAAYIAANGHPDAEERFKKQLEKLQEQTRNTADRLAGDPMTKLNINQRFLDQKFKQ